MNPTPPDASAPLANSPMLRGRLTHIDGLRGLCALYVVVHHICLTVWLTSVNPHPAHGLIKWTLALLYGDERVIMFCVLSGFCLMMPVAKGDGTIRGGVPLFFRRRAWRLLPPYYLALAISMVAGSTVLATPTGSMWDASLPFRWTDLLLHALMLHNFTDHLRRINYVLWSLAIEWQIYLLFPGFVWLTRRLGIITTVTIASVVGISLQVLLSSSGVTSLNSEYLAYFSIGAAAAWLVFRTHTPRQVTTMAAVIWLVCMISWACAGQMHPLWTHALAAIGFAALLTALGLRPHSWAARLFSFRPLVLVGLSSYSVYMLHPLVIELCQRFLVRPTSGLTANQQFSLLCPLALGCSLIVAAAFFYWVERPFMKPPLNPQPARIDALLRQAQGEPMTQTITSRIEAAPPLAIPAAAPDVREPQVARS